MELKTISKITLDIHGNVISDSLSEKLYGFEVEVANLKMYSAQLLAVAAKLEFDPYPLGGGTECLRELNSVMDKVNKL